MCKKATAKRLKYLFGVHDYLGNSLNGDLLNISLRLSEKCNTGKRYCTNQGKV